MNQNIVLSQARQLSRKVYYAGTDALDQGTALCYVRDYGTATARTESRDTRVERPDNSNNLWFAGVVARDYTANAAGQWIEIFEPGSVCDISVISAVTLGDLITALASTGTQLGGRFQEAGFLGRGTARVLQTRAAITNTTSVGFIGSSLDGTATVNAAGTTITKTSAFTYAAAGDYIYVLAGGTTATSAAAVTPGRYTISSVTSANAVVVSSAICATASSISFALVRGNPTVLAELQDGGTQSGLVEWITPVSGAVSPSMVQGLTNIFGGHTITTDATATLADGTALNQRKAWKLRGNLTTNDYLVTVTSGEQLDGSTDLATLEFDGASDMSVLEWGGIKWRLMHNAGTFLG